MSLPTSSSSIDYRQSLLRIISSLKYLKDLSQELNLTNLVEIISESLNRIENNSFKIVVLGDFNPHSAPLAVTQGNYGNKKEN